MCGFRAIVSFVLALALLVGATVHGARAAAMAMPMALESSSAAADPCDLCGAPGAEAAAQCAFVCAGLTGVVGDAELLRDDPGDAPSAGALEASAGRFAGPEPDPPR